MNILQQLTADSALLPALALVFAGGLLSGFSPCTMPTALLIIGYVGGRSENRKRSFRISLSFVTGISLSLAVLGIFASMAGRLFLNTKIFNIIAAFVVLAMGLSLLGLFKFDMPILGLKRIKKGGGILKAFMLGIPFGVAASPCTAPLMITVLAFVATRGNPTLGFLIMFVYAFARSLPLLAVGTFSGLLQRFHGIAAWSGRIEKASGVLLIFLGLYLLW